ncbi:hypothetical protein [uncultured Nocardioides sp.]|uniref:hypothetical protein n=1 Tax=uncultured Nocardioides sp. TaxID=198441 RepID=UPI0026372FAC|nr:hypothetical protein [uncultured Nocardioides sp.]
MSTTLDPSTASGPHRDAGTGAPTRPPGRVWVLAGLGAGLAGIASVLASGMVDAVYDPANGGDAEAITDATAELVPQILTFHTATMVSCALLVVFAAGLHRHLQRRTHPDSIVPGVAAIGLVMVCVAQLLGAGLTTEFAFGLSDPDDVLVPETVVFFGHWIGTIPWLWGGIGLTALALASAALKQGAFSRWLGWTSLVLGGLTTVLLVSPLQYMAGMTGPIWLVVVSAALLRSVRRS